VWYDFEAPLPPIRLPEAVPNPSGAAIESVVRWLWKRKTVHRGPKAGPLLSHSAPL